MFDTAVLVQFVEGLLVRMERKRTLAAAQGVRFEDDAENELQKMQMVLALLQDYGRIESELQKYDGMVLELNVSEKLEKLLSQSADGRVSAERKVIYDLLQQLQRVYNRLAAAERQLRNVVGNRSAKLHK